MRLPTDLLDHGYTLIIRAPDRLFAVSKQWGCTGTKATLAEVGKEARAMIGFCQWMNEKGLR